MGGKGGKEKGQKGRVGKVSKAAGWKEIRRTGKFNGETGAKTQIRVVSIARPGEAEDETQRGRFCTPTSCCDAWWILWPFSREIPRRLRPSPSMEFHWRPSTSASFVPACRATGG